MRPLRFPGGFLLTSPLDATPFEEDQEPLIELRNSVGYGTSAPTPPIISNKNSDPPRQIDSSDDAESDITATSTDVRSQTSRSRQRSRDGYASLPVRGKKESHSVSTF